MADPTSPTANMKIGSIYVRGRILQSAIPYFEEAIGLDANYAPAYRELGQLYMLAGRFAQSREYFEKYLQLTAGNIPAKVRYVNALFYARDYDGVITNVEEIFQVDRSRTYMNRIAGYSSYEKDPPDYTKALAYMETLFSSLTADRIIPRDYQYMARILIRKNATNATTITNEANTLRAGAERDRARAATMRAGAERDELNATIESNIAKADSLDAVAAVMYKEASRAFEYYDKLIELQPDNRAALLTEVAGAYNSLRNYRGYASTLARTLGPLPDSREGYMQVGRAYYQGELFQSADSVFNLIIQSSPDYVPAYSWSARIASRLDPDATLGLAKPKFDRLIAVAQRDSVTHKAELSEALQFLSIYYMSSNNYSMARAYYNRLAEVDPSNNDNRIRAYNGIGLIELRLAGNERTNEGRLPFLSRARESFNRTLAIDANNASARAQLAYIGQYETSIRSGINPNEIRGVVTDAATRAPIAFASIRVKDTAAEALTNQRGEFRFEIPAGMEALIFSARDYRTVEIPITATRTYNVELSK
jgi:tetratricopeptide (TPR) repeat protein